MARQPLLQRSARPSRMSKSIQLAHADSVFTIIDLHFAISLLALSRVFRYPPLDSMASRPQLLQQRLRLLQIARVEAFREPPVNRSKQFARLLHLALVAPEACEAHGGAEFPGFCLLLARDRERALEIGLPLSPHPARATSARFLRPCDGLRPRTTFPWLFPPPSSLRQCSAKHHRIGRVPHGLSPNMTNANGIHTCCSR